MDKLLWTVRDVMEVIPLGKTRCIELIKTLPHINTGHKLLVEPSAIMMWMQTSMIYPAGAAPARRRARKPVISGLTEDGLIPKRKKSG